MAVFLVLLAGCFSQPSLSGGAANTQDSTTETSMAQSDSDDSESSSLEEDLEADSEEVLEDDADDILAEDDEVMDEGLEEDEDQEQIEAATEDTMDDSGLEADLGAEAVEDENMDSDAADADLPDADAQSLDGMSNGSLNPLEKVAVYFGFDKYNLNDEMLERVKEVAVDFMDNEQDLTLKIEGNADERGTDEYNYALALRRAQSVKNALVNYGLNPDKINLVSYGESNPVCEEQTRSCYSKNRRVNFKILP